MWGFISKAIGSIGGINKNSLDRTQASVDISDDETCSNDSSDDGLECPICCESFNIVENVPYVLWCGHTLCKNCVLGLQLAVYKFSNQKIQIPFFISCPWCHLLTLRLVYKGNLKFPCKNYFLLWMVESLNGDRLKTSALISGDSQPLWSPKSTSCTVNQSSCVNLRRSHRSGQSGSNSDNSNGVSGSVSLERTHSFHKSLDFFINLTAKIPLVLLLLLVVLFVIPASISILALYLLITVLFALPSFLVLYFAYPALEWLARELAT